MRKVLISFVALVSFWAMAETAPKETVLFIGAHPDDAEAFMGLALRLREKYTVQIVDFTRGEGGCGEAGFLDGSTALKRIAEEREVCKAFGTEPRFLSQINFRGRSYAEAYVTAEIERLLLEFRPRAVFTHWPVDTHPDHVQCSAAVQHALSNVRRDSKFQTELYFFEEPPWQTKNFHPVYYVDVSGVHEESMAQIRKYVCQNGAGIAAKKEVRMRERGAEVSPTFTYAEAYTTFSGQPLEKGVLEELAVRKERP